MPKRDHNPFLKGLETSTGSGESWLHIETAPATALELTKWTEANIVAPGERTWGSGLEERVRKIPVAHLWQDPFRSEEGPSLALDTPACLADTWYIRHCSRFFVSWGPNLTSSRLPTVNSYSSTIRSKSLTADDTTVPSTSSPPTSILFLLHPPHPLALRTGSEAVMSSAALVLGAQQLRSALEQGAVLVARLATDVQPRAENVTAPAVPVWLGDKAFDITTPMQQFGFAIVVFFPILALICCLLRAYARYHARQLGADDMLVFAAMVCDPVRVT